MSNTDNTAPIEATVVEKTSLPKKVTNFVKNHKVAIITVVGLGALIGASALLGRDDDNSYVDDLPELDNSESDTVA